MPTCLRCYRILRQRLSGGSNSNWLGCREDGSGQPPSCCCYRLALKTETGQEQGCCLCSVPALTGHLEHARALVREGGRQGCGCLLLTPSHDNEVRKDTLTHEQVPSFLLPKGCLCSDPRILLSLSSARGREGEEVLSKANIQKECDQHTFPCKGKHLL